jgi:hypothetical protein
MITPFKDRVIDYDKPVMVYRNLNRKETTWSIKQGSYVVAHATSVNISSPTVKISPSGKKRAVDTGIRNVHAYICGYIVNYSDAPVKRIRYNPFVDETFHTDDGKSIEEYNFVVFNDSGAYAHY